MEFTLNDTMIVIQLQRPIFVKVMVETSQRLFLLSRF